MSWRLSTAGGRVTILGVKCGSIPHTAQTNKPLKTKDYEVQDIFID